MTLTRTYLVALACLSLLLTACASSLKGESYSRDDARQVQTVEFGTIEATRFVVIEGTKTPIGTLAGAAVGGIAGSGVGNGSGSQIAAVVGAVAGGLAGSAAEEQLTKSQGIELVVRLQNNQLISVVQAYEEKSPFYVGDRVRVLYLNGNTRIAKM